MKRIRFITGFLLATILVSTVSPAAHAAFPGLNGRILFVENSGAGNELVTAHMDGSGRQQLTTGGSTSSQGSWSPDGTRIVFMTTRDGNGEIYVMNSDGTSQTRLTNDAGVDNWPAWSPDGTKIVFQSSRSGITSIWTMNADGSNPQQVTALSSLRPAWSPDGQWIVFYGTRASQTEVYKIRPDGTNETILTNTAGFVDYSSVDGWSPDGTKIAFGSGRDKGGTNYEVYVMNADGSNEMRLTNDPVYANGGQAWSPDGQYIFFTSDKDADSKSEIYRIDPDGSGQIKLLGDSTYHYGNPSVQPLTILPTLLPDTAPSISSGDAVTANVLANDTDTYESIDPATLSIVSVSSGTATANPDGTITYQSVLGYSGTAEVTYRVCSTANSALCNTAVLSISVTSAGQLAATGENRLLLLIGGLVVVGISVYAFVRFRR